MPQAIEGAIVPAALFLLFDHLAGTGAAIAAALAWSFVAIARRVARGRRVPGMVILSAVTLIGRSVLSLATGSTFLYFLQPALGAVCLAGAFLGSVVVGRPLAHRFAADFCELPGDMLSDLRVRSFFQRVSIMWGVAGLAAQLSVCGSC